MSIPDRRARLDSRAAPYRSAGSAGFSDWRIRADANACHV